MDRDLSRLKRERDLDPESKRQKEAYQRARRRELPKRELLEDLSLLFDPELDASQMTVHGLALGDPVSKVKRELVTGGSSPEEKSLYWNEEEGIFFCRKKGEEKYRPYLPGEIYDDVVKSGQGTLCLRGPKGPEDILVHVSGSVIQFISITGKWLASLNIRSAQDMPGKWGCLDYFRWNGGVGEFLIPDRQIRLSWENWSLENQVLTSICLSPFLELEDFLISAKDLILWSLEWRRANLSWQPIIEDLDPPEKVRWQRLCSLFSVFKVFSPDPINLTDFFEGRVFERLTEALSQEFPRKLRELNFDFDLGYYQNEISAQDCRLLWLELYKLLFRLQSARNSIDGDYDGIECRPLQRSIINYRFAIEDKLEKEYEEVLGAMAFMIDPSESYYSWGALVREHQFPSDDLESLEEDRPVAGAIQRIHARFGPLIDWYGGGAELDR